MPKILAVDDSVTMRRVLELTFAGLDGFDVVAFEHGEAAVQHAEQHGADLVIADLSMSPDGYEICRKLKASAKTAGIPVLLLGSQHTPVDADKVKDCGAEDTALKPYEPNAFIEKVKATIAKGGTRAAAGQLATYRTAPAAAPAATTSGSVAAKRPMLELAEDDEPEITIGAPAAAPAPPPAPPGIIGRPAAPAPSPPKPAAPTPGRATIGFGSSPFPAVKPAAPAPTSAVATPAAPPAAKPAAPAVPASVAAPAAATVTAAVAPKLEGMGLTPEQVQGVLALTREVVERVVWEVVPDLAETLIREEIKRLTQ